MLYNWQDVANPVEFLGNGGEWLIQIVGNPQTDYESNYGMGIQRMTAEWVQTGNPKEKADLYANGLIPRED